MNSKWHRTFMQMALLMANNHSKDPNAKVGALIVKDTYPLSFGYNGIIRGFPDFSSILFDKEKKLIYTEHAERNAIFNAVRNGINLIDTTIYCTHPSCHECARAIIQSGIKNVVFLRNEEFINGSWKESIVNGLHMFHETNVNVLWLNPYEINLVNGENTNASSL